MVHEVVELIRKGPLSQATGQLANAARERMRLRISSQPSKPDDLTVVAFRLASLRERSDAG
jgi:hypothetical protein